jgi:hypothetical protein
MKFAKDLSEIVLMLAVAFCGTCLALAALQLRQTVKGIENDAQSTTSQANLTVAKTGASVASMSDSVDKIRTQADRLIIVAAGAAANIEKATRSIQAQENAQSQYWAETSRNVAKLTADSDQTVMMLQPVTASLNTSLLSLNADLQELKPAIQNANTSLAELPQVINNTAAITENLAGVTDDGRKLADFYAAKLTAPVTFARKVGEMTWHSALIFSGAFLGGLH